MKDSIVIFAKTQQQAINAAETLPVSPSYIRFFLVIGSQVSDYSWLKSTDEILALHEVPDKQSFIVLGIKLGVLYTLSNKLVFCTSNQTPNKQEIIQTFGKIDQMESLSPVITKNAIGFSREFFVINGFPDNLSTYFQNQDNNILEDNLSLAEAMQGHPSNDSIIIRALQDITHFDDVFVDNVVYNEKAPFDVFWSLIKQSVNSYNLEKTKTFFIPSTTSKEKLVEYILRLETDGAVITVTLNSEFMLPPHQIFKTESGINVLVYLYGTKT